MTCLTVPLDLSFPDLEGQVQGHEFIIPYIL